MTRAADGFCRDTCAASGRKHRENRLAASAASSCRTAVLSAWKTWHSGTVSACTHTHTYIYSFHCLTLAAELIPTFLSSRHPQWCYKNQTPRCIRSNARSTKRKW